MQKCSITDRNKGISNEVREKRYQEYVRGWVEYFRLADMKELLRKTDEWARRRIRAVYWKQWKNQNEIPNAESIRFRGLES